MSKVTDSVSAARLSRRQFLQRSTLAAAGLTLFGGVRSSFGKISANEKLNIGVVGTANRAASDIAGVEGENIVALCDIDATFLAAAKRKFPQAETYQDFRKMLEQKNIDAVVVATPDHMHAVATAAALHSGRPVYCEKPLTHTVSEVRIIAALAKKKGLATQMGNQIHASNHYRRVVEIVQSGALGPIRETHCFADSVWEPLPRPTGEPVPATVDYEQWLGPVKYVPYSHEYLPFSWRRWWAFGGGTLSDFCCHLMDLPFWACDLKSPLTIAAEGPPVLADCVPAWLIVNYEFAARGKQPPMTVTWYSGGKRPKYDLPKWGNGVLFVGDKGMLLTNYDKMVLLPEKDFAGFVPPPKTIPDSIGHHAEWIRACKTGSPTTCNFQYGALLTETGLLGNVAYRTGKKLEWDYKSQKAANCPEADEFLHHDYRPGWKI